jgi:hypothetical protein
MMWGVNLSNPDAVIVPCTFGRGKGWERVVAGKLRQDMTAPHNNGLKVYPSTLLMSRKNSASQSLQNVPEAGNNKRFRPVAPPVKAGVTGASRRAILLPSE